MSLLFHKALNDQNSEIKKTVCILRYKNRILYYNQMTRLVECKVDQLMFLNKSTI